jgi:hypothetical protein
MALSFPTQPEPNQIYTEGNRSWKWNGRFWEAVSTTIGYAGSRGYTGSTGYTGSRGRDGYTGSFGYTGSLGYTGSQGITGYWGSTGYVGSKGSSAYEIAVSNGFVGTEAQWLTSLIPPTVIPKPNAGIAISNNTVTTIYNTLVPDNTTSIAIGGAAALAASAWKTKSIVEVLDTILFPDQAPTYTYPTISLSSTAAGTKEVGEIYNQALTLTVIKNDAGVASGLQLTKNGSVISSSALLTGNTTNVAAQFGYPDPNNPNQYYRITASENGIVTGYGSVSWAGSAFYDRGLSKQNNKGVTATTYVAAGSLGSNAVTVSGIYPWFWGVSSAASLSPATVASTIQNGITNKNLTDASGTVSIEFAANSQWCWVAIPDGYTQKTKWYNTALNAGDINSSSFIDFKATTNVTSPSGLWSNVPYKIYITNGLQTTSGVYQLLNS